MTNHQDADGNPTYPGHREDDAERARQAHSARPRKGHSVRMAASPEEAAANLRARQADPVGLREALRSARDVAKTAPAGEYWRIFERAFFAFLPAQPVAHNTSSDSGKNNPLVAVQQSAQAVEPRPLDVERLAQAIRTAEVRSQMDAEKMGAVPAEDGPMPDWYRAYAADVAAEYAALSPDKQPKGAG